MFDDDDGEESEPEEVVRRTGRKVGEPQQAFREAREDPVEPRKGGMKTEERSCDRRKRGSGLSKEGEEDLNDHSEYKNYLDGAVELGEARLKAWERQNRKRLTR